MYTSTFAKTTTHAQGGTKNSFTVTDESLNLQGEIRLASLIDIDATDFAEKKIKLDEDDDLFLYVRADGANGDVRIEDLSNNLFFKLDSTNSYQIYFYKKNSIIECSDSRWSYPSTVTNLKILNQGSNNISVTLELLSN